MSDRTCPMCHEPVSQPASGRPRTYCSAACRIEINYEIRRLQRRLALLDVDLDEMERSLRLGMDWNLRTRPALRAANHVRNVAANRAAHQAAMERLRALSPTTQTKETDR